MAKRKGNPAGSPGRRSDIRHVAIRLNGVEIGAITAGPNDVLLPAEQALMVLTDFAQNLYGPLFNDGRSAASVRMAALDHLTESLGIGVNPPAQVLYSRFQTVRGDKGEWGQWTFAPTAPAAPAPVAAEN